MKISELEKQLKEAREKEGDIDVRIDTISHTLPPDLAVRERNGRKVLILNS